MRLSSAALALGLGLSQTLAQIAPAEAQSFQTGEHLLLNPPANWTLVPVQKGEKMNVSRMYPPGEDEQKWTQSLTIQVYPYSEQMPRPFIENLIHYSRDNCDAVGPGPVTETSTNGYPMAVVTITCTRGRTSGMGSFVLIQSIKGKDALYVVQRQWRGPAFSRDQSPALPDGMLQSWANFAKTVSLCDTRDTRHAC